MLLLKKEKRIHVFLNQKRTKTKTKTKSLFTHPANKYAIDELQHRTDASQLNNLIGFSGSRTL